MDNTQDKRNEDKHTQDISYIELNTFIKMQGLASTGGQAKILIRDGEIKVNGETETRNKRKLHENDTVEFLSRRYTVKL